MSAVPTPTSWGQPNPERLHLPLPSPKPKGVAPKLDNKAGFPFLQRASPTSFLFSTNLILIPFFFTLPSTNEDFITTKSRERSQSFCRSRCQHGSEERATSHRVVHPGRWASTVSATPSLTQPKSHLEPVKSPLSSSFLRFFFISRVSFLARRFSKLTRTANHLFQMFKLSSWRKKNTTDGNLLRQIWISAAKQDNKVTVFIFWQYLFSPTPLSPEWNGGEKRNTTVFKSSIC